MTDRQRELHLARCKRYREKHPERVRQAKKKWDEKNPYDPVAYKEVNERYKVYRREYYLKNKEKFIQKAKDWNKANPDKVALKGRKQVLKQYGLTIETFEEILKSQGGVCAVCKRDFTGGRRVAVDHCHVTNVVRGILCTSCNTAEGLLKTPENILRLYQYALKNELFYQGQS